MRPLRVAVLGAGMAGILAAIKLREAGIDDFVVYEKAERLGGTWRENRYPGIGCDVPSHLYSYSFALNPDWSRRYSPGPEIQSYLERVAREHGVLDACRFGDEVKRLTWRDGRWEVETASGLRDTVDAVIAATGVLHHPKLPDFPGLEDFEGECFHSARWPQGLEVDGQRVGVVGTGSSAVQIVGAITECTAQLTLFQRTPQWIMPQENPEYSEDEKQAFRRDDTLLRQTHGDIAKLFTDVFSKGLVDLESEQLRGIQEACLQNLETSVRDPALRERLRPDYRAVCKRLVVSTNFYDAIQQPHAELVTEGIERVEAKGVRTGDGRLHELDVLVLATGFQVDRFLRPIEVHGRDGKRLEEVWKERPYAYLAIGLPDFPNLFMLNGPNGPVGNFSLIQIAEHQVAYVLQLLELLRNERCREVAPSAQATVSFEEERSDAARNTIWATGCRSWYLDDRGVPSTWPWDFERFQNEMRAPRLDDFDLQG